MGGVANAWLLLLLLLLPLRLLLPLCCVLRCHGMLCSYGVLHCAVLSCAVFGCLEVRDKGTQPMSTRRPSLGYALRCLFPSSSMSHMNVLICSRFFWGAGGGAGGGGVGGGVGDEGWL